jgi:DNA-binding response OmpR family regulator
MPRGDATLDNVEVGNAQPEWEAPASLLLLGETSAKHTGLARTLGVAGFVVLSESQRATAWRVYDCRMILAVETAFERLIKLCISLRVDGFSAALIAASDQTTPLEQAALLNAGADDVLDVLTNPELMTARLRAVQRRVAPNSALRDPHLSFVPSGKVCGVVIRGRNIALTPIETRILSTLVQARGAVIKLRDLRKIASPDAPLSTGCLPVHMTQLRKKLGDEGWRLQNQRGIGYMFLDLDGPPNSG